MRKFGEGTFGRVVECWDRKRRDYVAVKIIRNIQVGEHWWYLISSSHTVYGPALCMQLAHPLLMISGGISPL